MESQSRGNKSEKNGLDRINEPADIGSYVEASWLNKRRDQAGGRKRRQLEARHLVTACCWGYMVRVAFAGSTCCMYKRQLACGWKCPGADRDWIKVYPPVVRMVDRDELQPYLGRNSPCHDRTVPGCSFDLARHGHGHSTAVSEAAKLGADRHQNTQRQ
nr:hypothetical protein CFP56_32164 [Quercus suber]